jgi:hypothetical protein
MVRYFPNKLSKNDAFEITENIVQLFSLLIGLDKKENKIKTKFQTFKI